MAYTPWYCQHEVYKNINLTKSSKENECSLDCACTVAVMEEGYVSNDSEEEENSVE